MKRAKESLKLFWNKTCQISLKKKIISSVIVVITLGIIAFAGTMFFNFDTFAKLAAQWPASFAEDDYVEPDFVDDPTRENNAFNVEDFGKQGNNGWFYRYGKPTKPTKSRRMEIYNQESYKQSGEIGMEIKSDFVHTGDGVAPILEWRAAKKGKIKLNLTYVKNVNGDKNPSWPDGVRIYIYKGEELLESHNVDISVDKEVLMETEIEKLSVKEKESIYIVVDPKNNNAYDGGLLYVAITDVNKKEVTIEEDTSRVDNNANNIDDYGVQGKNGWQYMYGKEVASSKIVSTETKDGYMNYTSPALVIKKDFIHPAINDDAILCWTPKQDGVVEVRGKYTKFAQNDGNPDWPDGTIVQMYLNDQKLYEQEVKAPSEGEEKINFREATIKITTNDKLYFVVKANKNSSYDGGCFDVTIFDRNGRTNEDAVIIDESETRQNFANIKDDFGEQGKNGWIYQEGYQDEPFGGYNIDQYTKDDKYADDHYLEIKKDYVNTGEKGRSAVIKWKVAQNGRIQIDASYTKLKNEDKNPAWPDGTRVTIYHNNSALTSQNFAAEVSKEVTKSLNVSSVTVKRGDYITMVINGKDNNAYDGGEYTFAINGISGLVGATESDVAIENDINRTNNANALTDFGNQGKNGWFYQYGYYTDPYFAVNIEQYQNDEKYFTNDGVEIKRDFIIPSTKGKSANVKWIVAQNGKVHIFADYTKLKNEDASPSWPDGTTVTLLHNQKTLKKEYFGPNVSQEITKDLSVINLDVQKGDSITLIVNGLDNTAYDGGRYSFEIEDANTVQLDKKNESKENRANLATDFGEQGSNGWYYLEGRTLELSGALTKKTDDNTGYVSVSDSDLQVKKDFVQPGLSKDSMYQWVVAKNGSVDVLGSYVKFGQNDANPAWPDGTRVRVYLNDTLLSDQDVPVSQGDGNDNMIAINHKNQTVSKGDILTFAINAKSNSAWDGGRLAVQIKPYEPEPEYTPAPDNEADLLADFGVQGNEGWYYGFGDVNEFEAADQQGEEYKNAQYGELLLKKDGVHPAKGADAIYRWIAGADGMVDLNGTYYKSPNESVDTEPDGVKVTIYKNGVPINGMSYDVAISTVEEIVQSVDKTELEVARGDKLDFVISAKDNSAWDYGKLEMRILTSKGTTGPTEPTDPSKRTNSTELGTSFSSIQGTDGWYYGVYDWNGTNFWELPYDAVNERYCNNVESGIKPELKKDYVEPGNGNAAYKWVAAQNGTISIRGSYVKYPNADDSTADGVTFRIFQNEEEKLFTNEGICGGGITGDAIFVINQTYNVKAGDEIIFAVNPEGNDIYDGGKLSITISPVE